MSDDVGWKLHSDDEIHRLAVGRGQVEHPPGHCAPHNLRGRIPLERQSHDFGAVAGRDQRALQSFDVRFRAATGEGNLRRADQNVGHEGQDSGVGTSILETGN